MPDYLGGDLGGGADAGGAPSRPVTAWSEYGGRSLSKRAPADLPLALPHADREFHDILGGGGDGDVTAGSRPGTPRLTMPPMPTVSSPPPYAGGLGALPPALPRRDSTSTPAVVSGGLNKAQLFALIAVPALLIVNIFLIVYILVPVLSGSVSSTSGNVNLLDVLSVNTVGRVGVANANPAATLEVRCVHAVRVGHPASGGRQHHGRRPAARVVAGHHGDARRRRRADHRNGQLLRRRLRARRPHARHCAPAARHATVRAPFAAAR
jgi:hypothetical protein